MDINTLFETLTIKEIKQQNIKTRSEIEKKKEELRFLVSERYRDIIDAADTISEMKTCSFEIGESITKINNIYKDWNSVIFHKEVLIPGSVDQELMKKQNKLSVTAQIKLILNMPELIWSAIETKQFSKAALLFNVCQNISIHSQLSSDRYKNDDLNITTVITKHWCSLSNLENTIALVCRNYLKSTKTSHTSQNVSDSLCAILLLENQTINFVLKEYLSCVECQIQDWFSSKYSCLSISQQLESVTKAIMGSLTIVYELFIKMGFINQLKELSKISVKDLECTHERIYRYLPDGVALFMPTQKAYQQNCDFNNVETVCTITNQYITSFRDKYNSSFVLSFKHLTTVKSIGDVRINLEKIFDDISTMESTKIPEWNKLVLENSLQWKNIIKNIYSLKLKEIINENISSYFDHWYQSIEKFMETQISLINENEFDSSSFFEYSWTEFNKDVFFLSENSLSSSYIPENSPSVCKVVFELLYFHFLNFFDVGLPALNKSCNFESLVVKYKFVRPEIYQITRIFNNQLMKLVKEVICTIPDSEDFLWSILKQCLSSIVDRCINWLKKILPESNEENIAPSPVKHEKLFYDFKADSNNIISAHRMKMIILSQSVRTLYELLPSFQAGIMTSVFNSENVSASAESIIIPKRKSKSSRLPFLPGKRTNQQDLESAMWKAWNETITPLKEMTNAFIIRGIKSCISNYIAEYFQFVNYGFSSSDACDELCTKWAPISSDNIDLNYSMPSSLEAPTQCSWPMHILLLNMSYIISIFGAHSVNGKSSDGIRLEILKLVIDNFKTIVESEEFQENKFIQKQNVQLIFDLRFLLEIINAKSGIEKDVQDTMRFALNEIEKRVDPFDYEMMSKVLHQNLTQSIAKNFSLYWLLSKNTKKNVSLGQKSEIGTNQHNLIDLVNSSGKVHKTNLRFAMLPVSGYSLVDKNFNSTKFKSNAEYKNENLPSVLNDRHSKADNSKTNNFQFNNQTSNKSYFGRLGSNWF